jgi:integrase
MIESNRFQKGSLILVKGKTVSTWYLRFYEDVAGQRVYRKRRIGTSIEYPKLRDAERAALPIRSTINSGVRTPEKVSELLTHYRQHELTPERKAFATVASHTVYIDRYVMPKWGAYRLSEIKTVAVEQWLDSLSLAPLYLAPATRTKIRNIMSALFSHGIRHEWISFNPISKVRCSAKRLREPDVLTPIEFRALLTELEKGKRIREKAMVMMAGSTGLRRSEFIALRWSDVDFVSLEIAVTRSCVRGRFGNTKTEASKKPVPLHVSVSDALLEWRRESDYSADADFLFPSIRLNGASPLSPDMVLKKIIRPALVRAGVSGKVIGWHSFRHSLATNLRALSVDVKIAQELLRHASSRTTLDLYTRAVSAEKRSASGRQIDLLMGKKMGADCTQHPLAPLEGLPQFATAH